MEYLEEFRLLSVRDYITSQLKGLYQRSHIEEDLYISRISYDFRRDTNLSSLGIRISPIGWVTIFLIDEKRYPIGVTLFTGFIKDGYAMAVIMDSWSSLLKKED